jgi:hypothetical protein
MAGLRVCHHKAEHATLTRRAAVVDDAGEDGTTPHLLSNRLTLRCQFHRIICTSPRGLESRFRCCILRAVLHKLPNEAVRYTCNRYGFQLYDWAIAASDGTGDDPIALLTTTFPVNNMLLVMLQDHEEPH